MEAIDVRYEHQAFPSWRYHATLAPTLVHTPEEATALGPGWFDSPAATNPAPPASVVPVSAEDQPPSMDDTENFFTTKVDDLLPFIESLDDMETIARLRESELANPKYRGGRPRVIRALEARFAALEAAVVAAQEGK